MKESQDGQLRGLCVSCSKAGVCALVWATQLPILQCATYQASEPARFPTSDTTAQATRRIEEGAHKGLCSDCELRENCTFFRSEGGVWHCEYYR